MANINTPPPANSVINFEYPGYWAGVDWKMQLFLNDRLIHKFSFVNPTQVSIPVTAGRVQLKAKLSFRTSKLWIDVQPGATYNVILTYNRFWGSIKLHLKQQPPRF